jgi:hypothetical protein
LLALAALEDVEIHLLDVNVDVSSSARVERSYTEQPQSFVNAGKESKVHCLHKALYGLKLASRAWNSHFHGVLIELSFTRKYSDDGIHTYHRKTLSGAIPNADDITITGASMDAIEKAQRG